MVPSGASTGVYEAVELRDGDSSYHGKSVFKAIDNIRNFILPKLKGCNEVDQKAIDNLLIELDGTENEWGSNKSRLGANATLAVSMAICRAGAAAQKLELYQYLEFLSGYKSNAVIMPIPCFNVINGGSHATNQLAFQEFMILPIGATSFAEAMKMGTETYHNLKNIIKKKLGPDATKIGDEGGFAPPFNDIRECLEMLTEAIAAGNYQEKIKIALDVAASKFYCKDDTYDLDFKNPDSAAKVSGKQLLDLYLELSRNYPIVSIEDPFDQDDFKNFQEMTAAMGSTIQIVGDDLCVTNPKRINLCIQNKSCNSLLLKMNQIGTVTETIASCNLARENNWTVMVSHRSGETEDSFIADLVVGLNTGQIKTGAPCRSERTAKYNRLLEIEAESVEKTKYVGKKYRRTFESIHKI